MTGSWRKRPKTRTLALAVVALVVLGGCAGFLVVDNAHDAIAAGQPEEIPLTDGAPVIQGDQPGHPAAGLVPADLEKKVIAGDPDAAVAKYVWEHGGRVIPLSDGGYAIPVPEKIPEGIDYAAQYVSARSTPETAEQAVQSKSPTFLDSSERMVWEEVLQTGEAFSIEQGEDGYRHIVRGR